MFYTCEDSMLSRFDRFSRRDRFPLTAPAEFYSWQKKARHTLSSLLGLELLELCTASPAVTSVRTREDGILEENILIHVEKDVLMPVTILIPKDASRETRVFITPPGHLGGGKASLIGDRSNSEVARMIDFYNYDYALRLARDGYVAVAFDPRGFGERREKSEQGDDNILSSSCFGIAHMAESLGFTLMGLLVWDIMRLVDYIEARNEWGCISMLGFSGGGMQTLYTAALDERVSLAFISGYFYGFKDSFIRLNRNCSCNFVPGLFLHFDVQDIAAMIAPRSIVIQSGEEDHLAGERGMDNVREPYAELEKLYSMLGYSNRICLDIVPGGHHFDSSHYLDCIKAVEV